MGNFGSTEGDLFFRNEYFESVENFSADHIIIMDEERFLGDMFSRSYSLKESDGRVEVHYKTSCYLGKF